MYEQHNQGPGFNPYQPPTTNYADPNGYAYADSEMVLAERGTRFGAVMVDGLLAFASAIPGILIMVPGATSDNEGLLMAGMGVMILGMLGLAIYSQMYLVATTGQTLGKKWLGVRIVKLDGSPCGFVHGVVLRSWVMGAIAQIPLVGFIAAIVDPLLIFGEERRCLHDLIAGTKVVVAVD